MSDNLFNSFEDQLQAAARDIVAADLATAPAGLAPAPVVAPSRRIALWPTLGAAAACLVVGYILPHPASTDAAQPTAQVERVEVVRTDTVYREVPMPVERIVERPIVRTVEVVRTDTVTLPAPAATPRHAPRSLANDGFIYAFNAVDE